MKIYAIVTLCCLFVAQLVAQPIEQQIKDLLPLQKEVKKKNLYAEKLALVSKIQPVVLFFQANPELAEKLQKLPIECQYAVYAVVACGQGPTIFSNRQEIQNDALFKQLVDALWDIERFYDYMGGIVGYHVKTLELIQAQASLETESDHAKIVPPPQVSIAKQDAFVEKCIVDGVKSLDAMAELYVVGGAGDRLKLIDETTGRPLPVARLQFAGKTVLEHLVRDLEAREYLYYKLMNKQLVTPIVLMTSHDKQNDAEIAAILRENGYFGRPENSFFRLVQPLVPVVTSEGSWAVSKPMQLVLKPGGHGVVWKLADQDGAFDWLQEQKRTFCIVRQINNPLAGLDYNLLALAGYGVATNKAFGFESIPRLPNVSEGMNVLREVAHGDKVDLSVTNLEYTEFAKKKKEDEGFAKIADSTLFPANTNILFVRLKDVQEACKTLPVPGYLVNMKQPVDTLKEGKMVTLPGARLESTMQNIADAITNTYKAPAAQKDFESLSTFVLVNDRAKTMSVTKKAFDGKSLQETPEGCFYDLLQQNVQLLQTACGCSVADFCTKEEYISQGPSTLFLYHPALGPLYSIISQKIKGGNLKKNSELQIEAAEVSLNNFSLDGSLLIQAQNITGATNKTTGLIAFGKSVGHVTLENVQIVNSGIDRTAKNNYVKNEIARKECARIALEGHSELIVKDCLLQGSIDLVVPDGKRCIVTQKQDRTLAITFEELSSPHSYHYTLDDQNKITLQKSGI